MKSSRQTPSRGPVYQKPRWYLSSRTRSLPPRSSWSRQPSPAREAISSVLRELPPEVSRRRLAFPQARQLGTGSQVIGLHMSRPAREERPSALAAHSPCASHGINLPIRPKEVPMDTS